MRHIVSFDYSKIHGALTVIFSDANCKTYREVYSIYQALDILKGLGYKEPYKNSQQLSLLATLN